MSRFIQFAVFPLGMDYHLPHHLFPLVPHYRLRALHNLLMSVPRYRDEATVKTFHREKGRIRLQPENSALEPIYAKHVRILGKVVGVFREL